MPKKINYKLTTEELSTIEEAIKKHQDLRVRERARMVRLRHKEYKPEEIAELLSISTGQVYWWHKRWREEGLDGLADKPKSGRPSISTQELRSKLEELLEKDPQEMGYAFTVWTAPRLLAYLKEELNVQMHENTLRNILAELGFVYRRPKHDLTPLQDQEAKQRAKETIEELKKKPKPVKSNFSLWMKQP